MSVTESTEVIFSHNLFRIIQYFLFWRKFHCISFFNYSRVLSATVCFAVTYLAENFQFRAFSSSNPSLLKNFIFLRNRHTISSSTYIFLYLITSFYRVFFLPRIPRDYFPYVVFPQDDFSSLQRIFLLIHPILRITYYYFCRSSAEYF